MEQRVIKFKAKRLYNGEWVEGDLIHHPLCNHIPVIYDSLRFRQYRVYGSTVCQFTGLKDKDGKEIWEHDLLKDSEIIYEVIYTKGCFAIKMQIGFIPLMATSVINKEQLNYFTNLGSKFDRKDGK